MPSTVESIHHGFRDKYLNYVELTAQVEAWRDAFPDFVQLRSLAVTPEDRHLWMLVIGREPERRRPAVWVDGNMHALELAGSSVALGIAEDMIAILAGEDDRHDLSPPVRSVLEEVLFYIVPRMSPDGAELVINNGGYVRSVPRGPSLDPQGPRWKSRDMNDDGVVRRMRQRDDGGEFVESATFPGMMVARELDDEGPFYKLYPEGEIVNFDGVSIPDPGFLSDYPVDLNRNFPYTWAPEDEQAGAGDLPLSEVESRAVAEFTSRSPEIFAWFNLHTFGGVFIRPHGSKPDTDMNQWDLAIFRQIEHWGKTFTGYPMVSGCEEFTYQPKTPIKGDLIDYAYHQRGAIAYVCELWDLFEQVGLERPKRFVDRYRILDRDDIDKILQWDRDHNNSALKPEWKPFTHPQLGELELGGSDPLIGMWNPPLDRVSGICQGQSAAFLRVAAMAPRLQMDVKEEILPGDWRRITATVSNVGYLPTCGLDSARTLSWNEEVAVEMESDPPASGSAPARVGLGHLAGWGYGRHTGLGAPYFEGGAGSNHRGHAVWVVPKDSVVTLRAGCPRCGFITWRGGGA